MSNGGKGSNPRPLSVDRETFSNNWDKVFRKKTPKELDDGLAEDEAFKLLERQRREKILEELVRINEELGLYDDYYGPNRNTSKF